MLTTGQTVKVTIETPDGRVHEVTGAVVEMSVDHNIGYDLVMGYGDLYPVAARTSRGGTFELTVSGVLGWTGHVDDKIIRDHQLSAGEEWQCPYCLHINPIEARICGDGDKHARGCGARRPFVYGK